MREIFESNDGNNKLGEGEIILADEQRKGENSSEKPVLSLQDMLRRAKEMEETVLVTENNIDEMIERRQGILNQLGEAEEIQETQMEYLKRSEVDVDFSPDDYERLAQEGLLEEGERVEDLKDFDRIIANLKSIKYPSATTLAQLKEIESFRNNFLSLKQRAIEQKQIENKEQQEERRREAVEQYLKKIGELTKIIEDIESNPKVIDRLHLMAEKEYQEYQKKREKMVEEVGRCIQSIGSRHANSFKRMRICLKDEGFYENLLEAFKNNDQKKIKSICDSVRSRLVENIIHGTGETQIKEPREIIPWRVATASIRYGDAFDLLHSPEVRKTLEDLAGEGDEKAQTYLDQIDQIVVENKILRRINGADQILTACNKRKENDKEGITKEFLEAKKAEKAKKEKSQKEIDDLIAKGGFAVESPVVESIKGKLREVGTKKGAVLLERKKSKKGNDIWVVAGLAGKTNGLKIGMTSPFNMSSFPIYVRKFAEENGLI